MERERMTRRERVEQYYKVLLEQEGVEVLPDCITYILLAIGMALFFVPVQEMIVEGETRTLLIIVWSATLLINMAITFYMSKYSDARYENNKTESVAKVLFYMPIDHKEKRKFLFGKLFKILLRITIIGLIMQLGIALIVYHTISIWNVVYIVAITFAVPMIFCGMPILLGDMKVAKKAGRGASKR